MEPLFGFEGPDVTWWSDVPPVAAGEAEAGAVACWAASTNIPYTAEYFDTPATPTSFSGRTTYGSDGSLLAFTVPATARYAADVTLSQGAITLSSNSRTQTFASSGRLDVGQLTPDPESEGVRVVAEDGPQALWSVSLHALPVVLSRLTFDRKSAHPGQIVKAHYDLDGDVTLSATIRNAADRPVRSLAVRTPVAAGSHTLTWDGRNGGGKPVPRGTYTLVISYADAAGNSGGAQASIAVVPERVYVPGCNGKPLFKPRRIPLTCTDETSYLRGIHWLTRTAQAASGRGTLMWLDWSHPLGRFVPRPGARISLYRVTRCRSKGFLQFTRMRVKPRRPHKWRPLVVKLSCANHY